MNLAQGVQMKKIEDKIIGSIVIQAGAVSLDVGDRDEFRT